LELGIGAWVRRNLTVRYTQTPEAISNEICTVDFVMRNTYAIFHNHNPLEVYISKEYTITAENNSKTTFTKVIIVNKILLV